MFCGLPTAYTVYCTTLTERRWYVVLVKSTKIQIEMHIFRSNPLLSVSESEVTTDDDDEDEQYDPELETMLKEMGIMKLLDPGTPDWADVKELLINLDRGKISVRKAFRVIGALAKVANMDLRQLKLSVTSIHRKRAKARSEEAGAIRLNFKPEGPLTVHMDGKKVPPLSGKGKNVERQAVIVTGKM